MSSQQARTVTCNTHGEFESHNLFGKIWSRCPTCAHEQAEKERIEREAAEQRRRQAMWRSTLISSGIPPRFQERSLEGFIAECDEQRRALTFAEDYATDFERVLSTGRSAMFLGRPGTGKTHLACAIALRVMEEGYSAHYATVMSAIRRIKATWNHDSEETEREAIAAHVRPHLLVLDEVGVQFRSDTEKLILFDIINARYERRMPTLILSNLPRAEVTACLGERVIDRLREDGGMEVQFGWASNRGKS
jgi:DNA replication protein DnaC